MKSDPRISASSLVVSVGTYEKRASVNLSASALRHMRVDDLD